jgi:hypothetical protein
LCNQSKTVISGIYADGNKVKGGIFVNYKITGVTDLKTGTYVATVPSDVSDATIVDKAGKTVR